MCCTDVFSTLSNIYAGKETYNNNECDPYANECMCVSLVPSFFIVILHLCDTVWFCACAVYDAQVLNSCYVCEVQKS